MLHSILLYLKLNLIVKSYGSENKLNRASGSYCTSIYLFVGYGLFINKIIFFINVFLYFCVNLLPGKIFETRKIDETSGMTMIFTHFL